MKSTEDYSGNHLQGVYKNFMTKSGKTEKETTASMKARINLLEKAISDLMDGICLWDEIQAMTDLDYKRCKELENLCLEILKKDL